MKSLTLSSLKGNPGQARGRQELKYHSITHNRMSIQHGVLKAVNRTEPGDTESWVKAPAASHVTRESFPQPQGVSSSIK